MPKIPHSPIRMYFLLQPPGSNGNNQAESECKACGLRMKGNHASNMERHVRRSHPQIYEKYLELKQRTMHAGGTVNDFVDAQAFEGLDVKFEPANFIKIKKIRQAAYEKQLSSHSHALSTPAIDKQRIAQSILEACVELVTTNGRPFSLINDSGMRDLINLSLSPESASVGINESTVKELVAEKAAKLKLSILEKVSDNIMNVKVDIITVCNRSFMGISIYYYDQGEIFSHMISFTEINVRYDSNELESLVWRELLRFDTVQERVYCTVVDSGSNLNTFVNEIVLDETDSIIEINDVANIPTVNSSVEDSIENINCTTNLKVKNESISICEDGETNVRVITVFTENEDEENDLDWSTTEMITGKLTFGSQPDDSAPVTGMRCVADILQMAVYDSLKSYEDISDVIKETRSLYQKLLALSEKKIINVNLPSSISLVRWKSVCVMLEKIIAIKSACIKLGMVGEEEQFWNQVEDLLASLKPCQTTSDILQKERLTISDVYKVWFNCILETSKIESPFAKILTECMRQKQIELFNDKTFLAALFLDPRFNNMILSDAQKKVAIEHLVACHRKFWSDHDKDKDSQSKETNEEIDELEKIFQMQENSKPKDEAQMNQTDKLEIILKNFCDSEPRLKTTESVVSFWEKKKAQYPQIYNLARIMFSVPATQQSFLKLVSQVQYASNADIGQMSENLFNDVVLLRSNS